MKSDENGKNNHLHDVPSILDSEAGEVPSTSSTVKKESYRGGLIGKANSPLFLSIKKKLILEPENIIDKQVFDWFETNGKLENTWQPIEIRKGKFAVAFQPTTAGFPLDEALNLEKEDEVMRAFGFTNKNLPAPGIGVLGIGLRYGVRYKDGERNDRKDEGYPCLSMLKNTAKCSKTIDDFMDGLALEKYGESGLLDLIKFSGSGENLEDFKKQIGYGNEKTDFNKQMFITAYLPFLITRMYMKLHPTIESIKSDTVKCLNCDGLAIDDYLIGRYMKIAKKNADDEYRAHGFLIVHKDADGASKLQYADTSKNGARIVHHDASYDSVIANIKKEKELDKFDKTNLARKGFEGDVEKYVSEEGNNVEVRMGRNPENAEYNTPICRDILIDMDSEKEQKVEIILADNGHRENTITITKPAGKSE